MTAHKSICIIPETSGVGGMVSFRHKFSAGLQRRGQAVTNDPRLPSNRSLLIIGGSRDLAGISSARRRGIPVVQRLNGLNWLHRKRKTGLRHYLRAEYGNLMLNFIRTRLATGVIYQSHFARSWWEREKGPAPVPSRIVHNGVDLAEYTHIGLHSRPSDVYRILLVEGSLAGGYEIGLDTAVQLAGRLAGIYSLPVELMVVGKVSEPVRQAWSARAAIPIRWTGLVPRGSIPEIDRSAHLLFSADLNAACPNSVIEAIACGLPVVAFETGALPELVSNLAGRLAPYGGDPWQLDPPDISVLAQAAHFVLQNGASMRLTARGWAEANFDLAEMIDQYLEALGP